MASNETDHNNSVANWTSSEIAERRSRGTNVIHGFSYRCRTHHSATDGSNRQTCLSQGAIQIFLPLQKVLGGKNSTFE